MLSLICALRNTVYLSFWPKAPTCYLPCFIHSSHSFEITLYIVLFPIRLPLASISMLQFGIINFANKAPMQTWIIVMPRRLSIICLAQMSTYLSQRRTLLRCKSRNEGHLCWLGVISSPCTTSAVYPISCHGNGQQPQHHSSMGNGTIPTHYITQNIFPAKAEMLRPVAFPSSA